MTPTDALIRARTDDDGVVFLALPDVAALLLDVALTAEGTGMKAEDALTPLATALLQYGQEG